jgi:hypothetical protein
MVDMARIIIKLRRLGKRREACLPEGVPASENWAALFPRRR